MSSNLKNVAQKISNFLGLKVDESLYDKISPESCRNAQTKYDYLLQMRNDTK